MEVKARWLGVEASLGSSVDDPARTCRASCLCPDQTMFAESVARVMLTISNSPRSHSVPTPVLPGFKA